jgi:endonuclease/exonuclease/phosphatase family metal-dependent hydrolase
VAERKVRFVKLLQLNAWGGRLEKQIVGLIRKERPDIVCLQEIIQMGGKGALFETMEELQKDCGFAHAFHSPVFSFSFMRRRAHFGNAILSQLPLLSTETIYTNLEYRENFDFEADDYNIRNLQHAVLTLGEDKLNILNHHGHHIHQHKDGDDQTMRQMRQVSGYIDGLDGPVILTGDFNLAPHSESLEVLNRRLRNLSIEHKLRTTRTMLTQKKEVCDYIFINDAVEVKSFRMADELVSDHAALILDFHI